MKNKLSSIICGLALLIMSLMPSVSKAEGYQIWHFWCGVTIEIPVDVEMELDIDTYEYLETIICGTPPWA